MTTMRSAVLAMFLLACAVPVCEQVSAQPAIVLTANIAPPPLPVYLQPAIPGPGYLWSPGYWDWDPSFGYFWVPGTWVLPPQPNLLWTPAYWGWSDGVYVFHTGYWGPQVGFYGGVVYGFGYTGTGFQGGYWNGGAFFYNRAVTNITNVNIVNVYSQPVVKSTTRNVSYNGGAGGTMARPTPQQTAMAQQPHEPPTSVQTQQASLAHANPALRLSANHGAPPIAATPHAHEFTGAGVVAASHGVRAAPNDDAIQRPAAATPAHALPSGNALPASGSIRAAPSASPASGVQPVRPSPATTAAQQPVRPQAPSSGNANGGPQAAAIAQQRRAMQQQNVNEMARQQAARQQQMQRMNVMAQRPVQASRMMQPRLARPMPQRFAAPRAAQRGHR